MKIFASILALCLAQTALGQAQGGGTDLHPETLQVVDWIEENGTPKIAKFNPKTFDGVYPEVMKILDAVEVLIPGLGRDLARTFDQQVIRWELTRERFPPLPNGLIRMIDQDYDRIQVSLPLYYEVKQKLGFREVVKSFLHETVRHYVNNNGHNNFIQCCYIPKNRNFHQFQKKYTSRPIKGNRDAIVWAISTALWEHESYDSDSLAKRLNESGLGREFVSANLLEDFIRRSKIRESASLCSGSDEDIARHIDTLEMQNVPSLSIQGLHLYMSTAPYLYPTAGSLTYGYAPEREAFRLEQFYNRTIDINSNVVRRAFGHYGGEASTSNGVMTHQIWHNLHDFHEPTTQWKVAEFRKSCKWLSDKSWELLNHPYDETNLVDRFTTAEEALRIFNLSPMDSDPSLTQASSKGLNNNAGEATKIDRPQGL